MKKTPWVVIAFAVLAACGGRVIEQSAGTDAGPVTPGTGGYLPGPTPGSGGGYAMGGFYNVGGYSYVGGSYNVGGNPNTGAWGDGGYYNVGGSIGTGACPMPEPAWAAPNAQTMCDGVTVPPAIVKYLDDFEGGSNVFDIINVPGGWAVYSDVEEEITGGQGMVVAYTPLYYSWGSHDASSTQGMQMQGFVSCNPVAGKNSWGAAWWYETDLVASRLRPSLDFAPYVGMVIWARLPGPPGKGNMVVAFPTPATDATQGLCGCDASTCASCYAHYQGAGKITKTCWSPINIPFSTLKVPYGNTPPGGFDKAHVYGVELQFSAWATAIKANWPVDAIVDDIYLY